MFDPPNITRPFLALAVGAVLFAASPTSAQAFQDNDGVRLGFSLGGISLVGFTVEYFSGNQSVEGTLGTWAFRDVSFSLVGKQYLGGGDTRPYAGLGLWTVLAFSAEGRGLALLARAPVGIDWRATGDHHIALDLNINRALYVKRADPDDGTPPSHRLVPLPGLYYRWASSSW